MCRILRSLVRPFSALALVVTLVGVSSVPAYAGRRHSRCAPAAKATHGCCKTPVLKACCSDASDTSSPGAPAPSKVQVNPNLTAAPAIFVVDLASSVRPIVRPQSARVRSGPLDLPTLLSTLLI